MNYKKISVFLIFIILSQFAFCANDISLMKKAKEQGMTFYWDSLSETGMLEKNGHQISFRKNEEILILDNAAMIISDAPTLVNNQIYVSARFMEDANTFFTDDSENMFKVGAILIDAGHGGKDPGACTTYEIGGK